MNDDRVKTLVLVGAGVFAGFAIGRYLLPSSRRVNFRQAMTNPKIVHTYDIEDLGDKISLCRCWLSKTILARACIEVTADLNTGNYFSVFQFPTCDGSHNDHNKLTGDNVGPAVLKRRTPSTQ